MWWRNWFTFQCSALCVLQLTSAQTNIWLQRQVQQSPPPSNDDLPNVPFYPEKNYGPIPPPPSSIPVSGSNWSQTNLDLPNVPFYPQYDYGPIPPIPNSNPDMPLIGQRSQAPISDQSQTVGKYDPGPLNTRKYDPGPLDARPRATTGEREIQGTTDMKTTGHIPVLVETESRASAKIKTVYGVDIMLEKLDKTYSSEVVSLRRCFYDPDYAYAAPASDCPPPPPKNYPDVEPPKITVYKQGNILNALNETSGDPNDQNTGFTRTRTWERTSTWSTSSI